MTKTSLTEVPRTRRQFGYHHRWNFGKGDVREAFQRIFSPKKDYVLFQTIANKEAVKALRKYVGFRESMDAPWEVRKIESDDDPRYVPGASNQGNGLQFDNSLMDSYQRAIDKIANGTLKQKDFSHYPMVSTNGVHNLDRDPNAIFWPRVYLVDAEKQEDLKGIIDDLSGDESLEVLRDLESPQFYQMAEIETLHNLGIAPLVRLEQELSIGAQELSMYVDFLAQMTETYKWTGLVIFED